MLCLSGFELYPRWVPLNVGFPTTLIVLYTREGGYTNRLMRLCRWMGSHFHDWIDYNGVAFFIELLKWGRSFSGFLG